MLNANCIELHKALKKPFNIVNKPWDKSFDISAAIPSGKILKKSYREVAERTVIMNERQLIDCDLYKLAAILQFLGRK